MEKNIKLKIAYKGTNYHGWQIQKDVPSIAGFLQYAIKKIIPEDNIKLIGASRTDKGVHALGQVANFKVKEELLPSKLKIEELYHAINYYLPPDIRVLETKEVEINFHSRYYHKLRHYSYFALYSDTLPIFLKPYVWWRKRRKVNLDLIHESGEIVKKNLSLFTQNKDKIPPFFNFDFEILSLPFLIYPESILLRLNFVANWFLRGMIRKMVATIIELSEEKKDLTYLLKKLAPPEGLFLMKVE
jgi:tRNA pseudouridine38-40 synthase